MAAKVYHDSISLREWLDTHADTRARAKLGLIAGMAIAVPYAAIRFVVYAMFPVEWNGMIGGLEVSYKAGLHAWWARDTIMDAPRLVSLGASFWVGHRFWDLRRLGLHAERPRLGLLGGSVLAAMVLLHALFRTKPFEVTRGEFVVLSASSVIVAAHEELLFRGVLLKALDSWLGIHAALLGSAALFTVWHVQAQPVAVWPTIFLFGLVAAVLRCQGVGLVWLMAAHAVADSAIYLRTYGSARLPWWPQAVRLAGIGVALGAYTWAIRTRRRSPLALD